MCNLLKTEFMFELSGYVWTKGDNASWELLQLSEVDRVFINKHWNTEMFTFSEEEGLFGAQNSCFMENPTVGAPGISNILRW